ncbi:hypothetical protein K8R78_08060 [bacterium]|nr:hypothetical protein [bacterium]
MKKTLLALLALSLFVFVGCGDSGPDLSTSEGLVEAFKQAVAEKDKELLESICYDSGMDSEDFGSYADQIWEMIDPGGLTLVGEYTLEEGWFDALEVHFDSALYTEDGSQYELLVSIYEFEGKWSINGMSSEWAPQGDDEEEVEEVIEEEVDEEAVAEAARLEALKEEALEYLKAEYTDEVKAVGDKYAGDDFGGDVQYLMGFEEGAYTMTYSTANGYGDSRAYDNEAFRAEMNDVIATFDISAITDETINVFWVMEFPM